MNRDYAAEMRALIDAETAGAPYLAAATAMHIVEKLRAADPQLLAGWLDAQAAQFVQQAIAGRDRSARAHARTASARAAFAADARRAQAGDTSALASWLSTTFVTEGGLRMRLAEMRRGDLLYAAEGYGRRAADQLMQEAFLRVLARKVGRGTVGEHYDDAKLAAVWRSVSSVNR